MLHSENICTMFWMKMNHDAHCNFYGSQHNAAQYLGGSVGNTCHLAVFQGMACQACSRRPKYEAVAFKTSIFARLAACPPIGNLFRFCFTTFVGRIVRHQSRLRAVPEAAGSPWLCFVKPITGLWQFPLQDCDHMLGMYQSPI